MLTVNSFCKEVANDGAKMNVGTRSVSGTGKKSQMGKKVFGLLLFAFLTMMASNAQIYIGGSMDFYTSGGSDSDGTTTTDKPTTSGFDFSPMVGYELSDVMSAGVRFSIGSGAYKEKDPEFKYSVTNWGMGLFGRYQALEFGNFSLLAHAELSFGGNSASSTLGGTTTKQGSSSTFGFNVYPVVSYNLTDRISIQAAIEFLELGFNSTTLRPDPDDTKIKETTSGFDFGVNNEWRPFSVSVGFVFKL